MNEPTRDTRLLSADQIAIAFHLLREVHPQVTEVVKAHIAAQDAELQSRVEEAEDRANELANRLAAQDQMHAERERLVAEQVTQALKMANALEGQFKLMHNAAYWSLCAALAALAQPPGDE
jgi:hypothetical protein